MSRDRQRRTSIGCTSELEELFAELWQLSALRRAPPRLPARGRLLPHRRAARLDGRRRASGGRPGHRPGRRRRAQAPRRGRAARARAGTGGQSTSRWRSTTAPSSAASSSPTTWRPRTAPRSYEQGLLRIVFPIAPTPRTTWARADRGEEALSEEEFLDIEQREPDEIEIPATLPVLPLKETVVFPGLADAAGDRPGALGQARRRRRLGRAGMLALVTVAQRGGRRSPAGTTSTRSARRPSSTR